MSSVDDRIVNMQFNNKQFTQGVQQSQRDLTGLDKTLANAGKASGLGKMGDAATQVSTKFSAMQVAGVTAVATIANKVTLAAGAMLKKFTIQPIIDGFREYTTNLESVQTIMANTGKSVGTVNKYLDELNEYSDQTIYNFSQMAKNIGTFTAAGVELDTATSAIKGISNLAALSGSNSQQASTAMYQLSQAIAAGKVGLMDWNSVVNAGMGGKVFKNALAQTAVAMGDLSAGAVKVGTDVEIMGSSFRNSISAAAGQESWLSSEVLVTTLAMLDGRFSETALKAEKLRDGFSEVEAAAYAEAQMLKSRNELAKQGIEFSEKEYKAMVKKADAAYAAATQIKTGTQLMQVVQESIGSMWASAFEIILGDFEQSKELWGNVGDVVLGIVDKISGGFLGALRTWEERGGRMKIIDGLANVFGALVDIMGAVAKGFDAAFPDSKVSLLNRISKAFFSFSEALVPSEETLQDIGTIAEAVFSILHFGFTIVKGVAKGLSAFFGALFSSTEGARGGILSMVASIAEVIIAVEDWLTSGSKITRFLKGIGEIAGTALSPIIATVGLLVDAFASLISGEGLGGAAEAFGRAKDVFGGFIGGIIDGLDNLTAPFDGLKSDIADLASKLGEPFEKFIQKLDDIRLKIVEGLGLDTIAPSMAGLEDAFRRVNDKLVAFAEGLRLPSISMEDLGDAADWVTDKFNAMIDAIDRGVSKLDISSKLDSVKGGIKSAASGIGSGLSSLGSGAADAPGAAAAGGAAAAAGTAKAATSVFEKLGDALSGFFGIFQSIGNGIAGVFEWIGDSIAKIPFPDDALEWATVLNVLISGALIKKLFFSKGIMGQLVDSIRLIGKAATDSFDQLTDTLKTMQGAIKSEMIKNIAIAVALLVASLVVLSYIPTDKLAAGMAALSATMLMAGAMMQVMMAGLKKIPVKDLVKYGVGFTLVGVGMMAMATSVLILTAAVAALAFIPFDKLKQGLGAVAILMGIMTASLLLLSGQGAKVAAVGAAMALMAVAIDVMVLAVVALGLLPFDKVEQGLGAVAIGIGIMTAALLLLSGNSVKVLAAGGAMVMMATALDILIPLIVTMGLLPWDVVEQGLKAMAIGLGIMTLSLMLLGGVGPSVLAGGAAMLLLATSLNMLIPLLITMGSLPWEVVSRGLAAMGIALALLLAAGGLAMLIIPGLNALSIVIIAIGAAMFLAGTGMALFVGALALLTVVGTAAIGIIIAAIGAFIALLPSIAVQVAAAFVSFLQAMALAAPKIRKAMGTILENMIGTVRDAIPEFMQLFRELIEAGIEVVATYVSRWVLLGVGIVLAILQGLADNIPKMIDAAYEIAYAFIDGMGQRAVDLANAGADAMIDMLNGFADAVETKGPQIREAAGRLATAIKNEFAAAAVDIFTNIPMPSLPDWAKNPTKYLPFSGRRTAGGPTIEVDMNVAFKEGGFTLAQQLKIALVEAGDAVSTAIKSAIALLTNSDGSTPLSAQYSLNSKTAQAEATKQSTTAGYLDKAATKAEEQAQKQRDKAEKIKDKKKRQAELKKIREGAGKRAKTLRTGANTAARAAEKAQAKADEQATAAQQEMSFEAAMKQKDYRAAGDVRSQQGQDMADKSAALLAKSQAQQAEADRLAAKGDKAGAKKLRQEALANANLAKQIAKDAYTIMEEAADLYADARAAAAQAVRDRIGSIREGMAERDAERAWQKQFDEMVGDDEKSKEQKQADMLNARAKENEAKAETARAAMETALAEAERLANIDAEAANAQLDEAERQAQLANAAADSAENDREAAEQLLEQATTATNNGTTTSGASITPSRTALEDAANAVDRYTTSMQQAEEQAGAGSTTTQFVQNNYSPEALSASQLYRQGKNLVSAAEVKMAGSPG